MYGAWGHGADRPLTIVYNRGVAPIKFTTDDGTPSGLLNEYWQLLGGKAGIDFRFLEVDSFTASLDALKNGVADLHAGIFATDERKQYLDFSDPVLNLQYYIYSGPGMSPLASLSQTKGYIVGVVQGGYTEKFIKQKIPKSHLVIFADVSSLLDAVLAGEIRVFVVSDVHLNYYLSTKKRANTFHHSSQPLYEQSYHGAALKANHALIEKIQSAQRLLDKKDLVQLKERWLAAEPVEITPPRMDSLTAEELAWIGAHPRIRVSNEMDWPPFDFNLNGKPTGFSIDLLALIGSYTGLTFDYVSGPSWNTFVEMLRNKELDLLHSLTYSAERSKFMRFTQKPYVANQTVIVTAERNSEIKELADLEGKTIAVIKGYYQEQVLLRTLKNAELLYVDSPLAALKAVASGRADATIRYNSVANYLIHHHLLANLKFVNEFEVDDGKQHELFFGVRDDWPMLQSILNKGLDAVSPAEMQNLLRKWTYQKDQPNSLTLDLTENERKWLKDNPEISLGSDYRWAPFDLADKDGRHAGVSADFLRLIAERTGLKINIRCGVWADILAEVKDGKLDGLACAVPTEERRTYLDFSSPYLRVPTVIIVRKDNHAIASLRELNGKIVSINKGSYLHEWLTTRYPQIGLQLSTSNENSLEALSYGEVDAYIGNLAVADYVIREKLLTNLRVVKRLPGMMTETAFGVRKDKPVLLSILQKGLDSISAKERQDILNKWYIASVEDKGESISFSDEERAWLRQHPVINIAGPPDWAPIAYRDAKGDYVGIVSEYLKKIAAIGELQFAMQPADSWRQALQMVLDGKADVISGISSSEGQTPGVVPSESYMEMEAVLITRNDIQFINGLENLGDRRVGTLQDYVIADYLRRDYPALSLTLYENGSSGLQALVHGQIDAFVIDIPTFEYCARKHSLANLKISGVTPYVLQIAFGVGDKNPELVSILNKTLNAISQKEKTDIYNSWVTQQEALVDYSMIWKVVLAASGFLLLLVYWNRRLAHEVSLRKHAEHAAVQASRAKSDFLANMSHEIRTPMNSVLGFAELLDNMISDPEQKSYLKSIRSGGRALLEIINDILDLSKIEARKMILKPEPFSLAALFAEMEDFFKARIAQKNLQFLVELPEDFPTYIEMDHVRLRQILINLIGNSLKFTEKGSITLACKNIAFDEQADRLAFTLAVADTGIGIPPDQQQGIFDKFTQQDSLNIAKYGGTGLGLSICRSLVELMGGTISVRSMVGEGAEFQVAFSGIQIVGEKVVEQEQMQMSVSQFAPANVLIADDVEDNRKLVIGHFRGSAVTFHETTNGAQALQLLAEVPIDLVLMDLRMPELNGYETITAMKQDASLHDIPVVAFTASVMGEDLEKVNQYGFDDYLRKPISRQELLQVASRFLPLLAPKENEETSNETFADAPPDQLQEFLEIAETDLIPQWDRVKDSGDFELIDQFSRELHRQAVSFSISLMIDFADRLQEYLTSFDIIEVDGMMQQFPRRISLMKQRLVETGGEDDEEI